MSAIAELRETDDKGRVTLPKGFANSTLLIERVSDVELVIRKAKVVPLSPGGNEEPFLEDRPLALSAEDQQAFLAALENPPKPNGVLRKLMSGGPKGGKAKK
jgi:hypothetical protein